MVPYFQKILLLAAVLALGFSIFYYISFDMPGESDDPVAPSPIREDVDDGPASPPEFDVRDYGVQEDDAVRLKDYFADVKDEVSGYISRGEIMYVALSNFKTGDDHLRKLYSALTLADRIKILPPAACARLKQDLAEEISPLQKSRIRHSRKYIACFSGK